MSTTRQLLRTLLVVGIVGTSAGAGTWSAFSGTASNEENGFAAGDVSLSDNDSGGSVVALPPKARPGASSTGCIRVTYGGSLGASVHLYADVSGNLAPHLTLTVTRGTDPSPSFPSCASFAADPADYGHGPNGIVYQGPLSGFPGDYASGIVDGSPEAWTTSEDHSYRYEVTLGNAAAAQGESSSATFRWEARNL
jgi:hypothetical protein